MVEQYYESREFVLGGGVWKEHQKRYVRRWLKDDRGKGGPVGEHPIAASRVLFAELSRTRHSAKTDEARFEVKALWSVFLWGFRRGLWSFRDRPVSDWLDRAGLMERGVRDPYSEARWGVVQAAQMAEDAGKIEAEIRAANTSRNKKRRLLIKLVKAAESVADSVRIEDLAPLLRRPFQRADPNEIMLAVRRADDHLSAIVIASKDLLEDFDCAETSLAKRDVRTNAWAQVFVKSLARTYTLLTGNEPTVSKGKFLKFVEASYLSIWRGRGTPVWVHQVETALGKAKKPRNRAKIAARRAKP